MEGWIDGSLNRWINEIMSVAGAEVQKQECRKAACCWRFIWTDWHITWRRLALHWPNLVASRRVVFALLTLIFAKGRQNRWYECVSLSMAQTKLIYYSPFFDLASDAILSTPSFKKYLQIRDFKFNVHSESHWSGFVTTEEKRPRE
jgi:hypothetical protein